MSTWQVQAAKQRFSEVLRAAETGEPQFITRHGSPVAVILDIEEYRSSRLQVQRVPFKDFLRSGPTFDDLEFPERVVDPERVSDVELA